MNKMTTFSILALTLLVSLNSMANAHQHAASTSASDANVYIISPQNGATVSATFTIKFGLQGMGVSPAGLAKENTGHHHLLVDGKQLPALDKPLGGDVKHFGGGQTETQLTLPKGKHTLQLILADHQHMPHNPAVVSEKITIVVE